MTDATLEQTAAAQYTALVAQQQADEQRLEHLTRARGTATASREDYVDYLMLQDQVRKRAQDIAALEPHVHYEALHQRVTDAAAVHDAGVAETERLARAFLDAIGGLFAAKAAFEQHHDAQTEPAGRLQRPRGGFLFDFPAGSAVVQNMCSRLPAGDNLARFLLSPGAHAPNGAETKDVLDVIPGAKPLSAGVLQRYLADFAPPTPRSEEVYL